MATADVIDRVPGASPRIVEAARIEAGVTVDITALVRSIPGAGVQAIRRGLLLADIADVSWNTNACDNCGEPVHRDAAGYWVGDDESSDCRVSERGHEVAGEVR